MAFTMPMPIPKPIDASELSTNLHYLSFKDAQKLSFTNKHQPSLASIAMRAETRQRKITTRRQLSSSRLAQGPIITKLKNKSDFKIGVAQKVRGVMECMNCHKSRCIYSHSAISQMKRPLPPPSIDDIASEPVTSQ